jgi:hypothetical protein
LGLTLERVAYPAGPAALAAQARRSRVFRGEAGAQPAPADNPGAAPR